jgi:hypothetical protein
MQRSPMLAARLDVAIDFVWRHATFLARDAYTFLILNQLESLSCSILLFKQQLKALYYSLINYQRKEKRY